MADLTQTSEVQKLLEAFRANSRDGVCELPDFELSNHSGLDLPTVRRLLVALKKDGALKDLGDGRLRFAAPARS